MSPSALLYLTGMALLFVGERLVDEIAAARLPVDGLGLVALAGSAWLRLRRYKSADDEGIRDGERRALWLTGLGAASLLLYVLSTEPVAAALLEGSALDRWRGVFGALWPVAGLSATLPMLAVDRALHHSPVVAPPARMRQAVDHGLIAAFGIALVFPVNFIAARHSLEWDLAYLKTARPGSATRAVVSSLDDPVHVYGFFPPTSEVADEVEGYFAGLEGPKLTYRTVDQTARPDIAQRLRIRENGIVAFTPEDVEAEAAARSGPPDKTNPPLVETFDIGTDIKRAEKTLKEFDGQAQRRLIALSQGDRVAYLTSGHGEFSQDRRADKERRIRGLKSLLEQMSFRVETIGLNDGLADGIPEEADLVVIVGPTDRFLASEVDALVEFLDRGGSLLAAMEPDREGRPRAELDGEDPLGRLFEKVGVDLGRGTLAASRSIYPENNNRSDRLNLVTNQFSSHTSTATLARESALLLTPTTGFLRPRDGADAEVTVTVRSRSAVWIDRNGNLAFDADAGEVKKDRALVAAARRGTTGPTRPWRAIVTADATMLADKGLANKANQQFVYDGVNWLIGTEAMTGTTDDEEDVRIRHTKKGETVWFYGTVLGVPLLIFGAGALLVWRRRKGGRS